MSGGGGRWWAGLDLPPANRPDRVPDRPNTDEQEADLLGFNPYGSGPVPIQLRLEETGTDGAGHADAPAVHRLPHRLLEAVFLILYP